MSAERERPKVVHDRCPYAQVSVLRRFGSELFGPWHHPSSGLESRANKGG